MLTRTVKIPLTLTNEQHAVLLETLKTAAQTFNHLSGLAVQNKIISKQKLHNEYYELLRRTYPSLPSAYQQSLRDQLVESLKSIHSNHPKKKWTITPSKKQHSGLRLDARTFTIRGDQLTVSTVGKRVKTLISVPEWFTARYPAFHPTRSATLTYNKQSKKFFLSLIYTSGEEIKTSPRRTETVGLDRGIYNIVTTSDGVLFGSNHVRAKRREHMFLRSKLQQKGTPSAKRLLRKRAGKEKRFMLNQNHIIVNQLIQSNPNTSTFVLETLTGIRNHRRGRKMNTFLSQWSFHQLETILAYKTAREGIHVKHIDPRYTSQACNQCGAINKNNRKSNKYVCICGWIKHADINAAMNIRDLGLSGKVKLSQSLQVEQGAVNHPDELTVTLNSSPDPRGQGN